ncbi:MAG: LysM peptidoglycan-binding domain-containing protein [Deltaproteobacteria bacterium]|nr:LysM peptidoglycan-binding domain-containing protein [Deltaproteobacteria bacterium]
MRNLPISLSLVVLLGALAAAAQQVPIHSYTMKDGDTLWRLSVLFLDEPDPQRLAKLNDIKNTRKVRPGRELSIPLEAPAAVVNEYLAALREDRPADAWSMLSSATRENYSLRDFTNAVREVNFHKVRSLEVAEFSDPAEGPPRLRLTARMENDSAPWGFNLVWENEHWRILLLDLAQGMSSGEKEKPAPAPPGEPRAPDAEKPHPQAPPTP